MTTTAPARHPGKAGTIRIDHAATVTARMPTAEEAARGYPPDMPVLVVSDPCHPGRRDKVISGLAALVFGDPHATPEPDAVRDAALYVLGVIGEELNLVHGRVSDLMEAARQSPHGLTRLAGQVREERDAQWQCADASMCFAAGAGLAPGEAASPGVS